MKKLFLVFVTVMLALTGCTEDHLVNESASNGKIQASFEEGLASRLVVGEGNALTWSSGDAFKMFNEAGSSSIWTLEGTGGTETGVFGGNALEGTLIGAAFPASANPRIEGNTLKINLQPELMYAPGICNLPMWASFSSLDGTVSFKHLGALLKIDFTDIPEGYNSLTVTTDKAISGTFSADLSQSEPVLQPNANGKKSVKVFFDAIQGTENNDRLFYIPLPVGEYESINVSISDGTQTLSIAEWKNREIKRKKVYLASLTYRVSDATTPTEITEELEDMLDVTTNATVEITKQIDAADGAIEIPAEASKVGLNFTELPVTSSDTPLKIEEVAATNGAQLTVCLPASNEETFMEFNTPTTTVNVEGGNYKKIVARTAANTLVIGENTTVADLVIVAGNVVLDGGKVTGSITRDVLNEDEVTYIYVNDESELEGVTIGEGIEVVVIQTSPGLVETPEGIYEINSAAGLREFAASVDAGNTYAGKTIKLNRDIDLQNELWTPIGAARVTANPNDIVFQGTFDGQNHAIKNLKIQSSEYRYVGLFASVHGATIKNLTIMNGEVKNQYLAKAGYAGAFVGYSEGLTIVNCHNVNCAVTVERSDGQKSGSAAGLVAVGYEYGDIMPTYIACTNSGTISSPSNPSGITGGGFGVGANIVACVNTGDVVMTNVTGGGYPAGIVCNFGGSPSQYMYGCFTDCYVTEVACSGALVADAAMNGSNIHYSYSTNAAVRLFGQSWTAMNTTVSVVSSYSECVDNLNAGIEMYNASASIPCEYRFVAGNVPALEVIEDPKDVDYLSFTAESKQTLSFTQAVETLEYSVGGSLWTELGTTIVTFGGEYGDLRIRGKSSIGTAVSSADCAYIVFGNPSVPVASSGDIRTLVDYQNYNSDQFDSSNARFCNLFYNCKNLTSAPKLPATTLATECYWQMFVNCSNLTEAPELPATTLVKDCYRFMFYGCSSLEKAPELPATTLVAGCYKGLFYNCTNLKYAPKCLPATRMTPECYSSMFYGCTSLKTAPELPATTLAAYCYHYMFYGCTSLKTAPELPATQLANGCYSNMFEMCSSLTKAPELPATTLANHCYSMMFADCVSLEETPELPATTLASACYMDMFMNCVSLTKAPKLPVTTLAERCYYGMFWGCTGLSVAPELPATKMERECYTIMFGGCTGLQKAPELPGTVLAIGCYSSMFSDCTGLTRAPELPVVTLADGCYESMFIRCTGLTEAPKLPATVMKSSCYSGMFSGCTNLTSTPELPATVLAGWCYCNMFSYCTNLNKASILPAKTLEDKCYMIMFRGCVNLNNVTMLATDVSADMCLESWLYQTASVGTFYKDSSVSDVSSYGVPKGWEVKDY